MFKKHLYEPMQIDDNYTLIYITNLTKPTITKQQKQKWSRQLYKLMLKKNHCAATQINAYAKQQLFNAPSRVKTENNQNDNKQTSHTNITIDLSQNLVKHAYKSSRNPNDKKLEQKNDLCAKVKRRNYLNYLNLTENCENILFKITKRKDLSCEEQFALLDNEQKQNTPILKSDTKLPRLLPQNINRQRIFLQPIHEIYERSKSRLMRELTDLQIKRGSNCSNRKYVLGYKRELFI